MNRNLHYAILLSLALHGLILFGLSVERKAAMRDVPLRLEAKLVEPPAPPPPPSPRVEPVKPPPPPAPVAKPAARPKPPRPVAKQAPERVAPSEPVRQPEPPAAPQPAENAPAPPGVAMVEPQRAAPAGPSAEQLEAMTREQYRLNIIDVARGHNLYPPLARENNWEGRVLVRMVIGADGKVSLAVKQGSGHPVLDRQALEMFRRAQAAVPLPAALRGRELSFEFWAIYNLKDQVSG